MAALENAVATMPATVRVFSPRLNQYIDVSLDATNPEEDRLAGLQVVMLVPDHVEAEPGGKDRS